MPAIQIPITTRPVAVPSDEVVDRLSRTIYLQEIQVRQFPENSRDRGYEICHKAGMLSMICQIYGREIEDQVRDRADEMFAVEGENPSEIRL
jgi:hypothetical protein